MKINIIKDSLLSLTLYPHPKKRNVFPILCGIRAHEQAQTKLCCVTFNIGTSTDMAALAALEETHLSPTILLFKPKDSNVCCLFKDFYCFHFITW